MRTVTYDYVLQRACELTGRVFSTLTTEESNFFRTFISMSLRSAWECFDWPEQTVYQQEFFAQTYTFTDNGILVTAELPYVWLEFRKTPPLLSTAGEATAYAFPYRFCEICALKAAGQMLRVDGKIDLGNQFLELAEIELTKEIDKVALQEKYVRQIIVPNR